MIRQTTASKQSFTSDMDSILEVIWAKPNEPLSAFSGIYRSEVQKIKNT